ncbi:MAG: SDR family NAD(P)-dependent oxidoreductase [Pseudomonadota bacterium]
MPDPGKRGTLVVTGATAGFGLEALRMVVGQIEQSVIVGARDPSNMPVDIAGEVTVLQLDLARLQSVATFCAEVMQRGPISGLILNAGLSPRRLHKTEDGFDRAFQVNYLSHFAMIQRLWDVLEPDAHILMTGSGTHDPEEKTPPPPPNHANALRLAYPETDPERDRFGSRAAARSYTSSKLCCIMASLELARRRPEGLSLAYDPGLVPGTRLTREFPQWLVRILLPILSRTMPADRTSTLSASANAFAYLMAGRSLIGQNGDYVAMRGGYPVVVNPSKMARDQHLSAQLWSDSEALLAECPAWME